jgi:N-acetylmuramoyl-L-alanine amidase
VPAIYLSPSTQENEYATGGNEEYYMNLIADAMVPYLRINRIEFTRNNPEESIDEIIKDTRERSYDLYMALRSGFLPDGKEPSMQGLNVYHYAYTPVGGERAARYTAENLKEIYPDPKLVRVIPADTIELRDTNAPAILAELGYRGNPADEMWMKENIDAIAKNLVMSVTQFLNQPFIDLTI